MEADNSLPDADGGNNDPRPDLLQMQRSLEEARLVYETLSRISTADDVDGVIAAYLEQVAAGGRYACSVALYDHDAAGRRRAAIVRGRWSPEGGIALGAERLPYKHGGLDPLLDAGQTVTIPDVHADPRVPPALRRMPLASERPAVALIPLMARGGRIGVVVLSYPAAHAWRDEALRPYEATAAHLAAALDSRFHQSLLYERGRQIAILEERQRLARELHDSVTQTLFSAALIAQSVGPAWRRDPAEGERRIERLVALSQSALAEMRALLAELRPADAPASAADAPGVPPVRRQGLVAALEALVADRTGDGVSVALDAAGYGAPLPIAHEETLYRIAQEALNNVCKHARAHQVLVRLCREKKGATRLRVQDDGQGFVPAPGRGPAGGLGLQTMRERAEALGGALHITSAPGQGTTIEVLLPRPTPSEARIGSTDQR